MMERASDLERLREVHARLMGDANLEDGEATEMLAQIRLWFDLPDAKVGPVVQALAAEIDACTEPQAARWMFETALFGETRNGGALILFAALKIAAARGVSEKFLDRMRRHVQLPAPSPDEPRH